jgi:predicted transcriptional regulator
MAGRKTLALTDRQFAVLRILWEAGPLTVRELMERLPRGDRQPYTTVLGLLQTMEKAGLVTHDQEGVTYRYAAALSRRKATRTLLRDFLSRFFQGSAEALIQELVDSDALSAEDLRQIERKLSAPPDDEAEDGRRSRTRP